MRLELMLVWGLSMAAAKMAKDVQVEPDRNLSPAEKAHQRHFFSIGEGFEGTASDWTEYIVWIFGVAGVFYYMANPNARRNLYAVDDENTVAHLARQDRDCSNLDTDVQSRSDGCGDSCSGAQTDAPQRLKKQ